ncbi:immunoglobulin-like domain-containing protein [Listeria booriae]|uniref:Bacterial Ig domain-containing protein n=1 Tax=Listeria booriae TaxID=1552123 RepID=A0A7X0WF16_9LIST|nr:immunoglobulin-like domain-containing protein [Listeria booriae]MBC1332628.1 hypothetical protein [Listeria booriae]MBC2388028.1 hypothetical protein [Listeria booriae]
MLNNKMKKAASIMAVAALIGTSVTTPLGALTTKAAESQPQSQPSTLAVLNPNLLSQDISVSATNSKRFATNWNLTSGAAYTTLGYDTNGGAVATDAVGNIFHLTNASMSMQTTFKARTNVAVSQTIDTEIGKEYTYTSRFYLDESVGPGPTRTMVNRNITLQINDSTPRTLIGLNQGIVNGYEGTFSFVATSTKTNITLASIGTSSTRDYRLFQTLQSIKKSDKQVQQDAIALEQQAQQAVNNLFNGSNPANVIKTGLTQAEIDAAQNLVNQVTDETKKAAFQKNLDNAKKQLNDRIDAENKAQDVVNNLFENKNPNGNITGNVTKDDIDAAQDLIDKLANTTKKAELQTALNKAKQQLTDRIEAAEKEAQDKANEAVTNLFENNDPDGDIIGNLTQDDLDKAQDLINKVTDETKKAELQTALNKAKQQLTDRIEATEKEAQDKANEAVTNLFENNDPDGDIIGNLTQDDLDKAQDLINKVTDETKKAELQSSLDKAKQQLADRTNAEKEAQDAAKASVNDLFLNNDPTKDIKATTNQAAVNAAQEKVNTVTDPAVKEALQKQVDKAQAQVSARAGITGVISKYTVGDMYITGTYTGPATALSVDVNGKRYYGGDIANGTFKFYVADKNLKAGDTVIVNFYDSSKQIRTSVQVQVFEPLKVTVADYKIGDGYLTGTYNNNVAKVGLVVNGTKYWGGTVANGTVRFYAADKIRTADAEAVMNFYDENNNLLASKTIKIQAAYTGEITTAEFTLGATYITGELTGDITQTAISINGKKYYGGTIASNKTYKFYVLDKRITTADEVIVYGYSADNRLLSQKTVTITQ